MKELVDQAKDLMKWAQEYGVDEISLENGDEKISIARNVAVSPSASVSPQPVCVSPSVASAPVLSKPEKPVSTAKFKIESPMVGTFYRSPSPGAPAFVEVGQSVKSGDTVCIVEAMKVMNQIKSPYDGVVRQILSNNAQVVYKGQVLIEID